MAAKVMQFPKEKEEPKRFSAGSAWTPALAAGTEADRGHVTVVRTFLRHYSTLKPYPLNSGEALFVIHLMDYKWGDDAPWPSYRKLAEYMGISAKMARRHAQSLETKGYLKREVRRAMTNRFDLKPLFRALELKVFGEVRTTGL